MSTHHEPLTPSSVIARPTWQIRLGNGLGFDWLFVSLSLIFVSGLFLDGWAHNHGKVDNSFFTVWHAFFYSGFALTAAALILPVILDRIGLVSWQLPAAYRVSLLGTLVFAAGGVGDLVWHELFGIEEDFEALVSPSHLILGLGLCLVVTGPVRAAWNRPERQLTWRQGAPALLSITAFLSVLTFFMMFSHPLMSEIGSRARGIFNNDTGEIAGVVSILFTSSLIMGCLLFVLRRWQLPRGAISLLWGINSISMAIVDWEMRVTPRLLAAVLIGVLLSEGLWHGLHPSLQKLNRIRLWSLLAPCVVWGAYFLALVFVEGTRWSIHLLTGGVVLAGAVGWLLTFLVFPPPLPVADSTDIR